MTGIVDTGYFPTTLSKSFLHYCLFGEVPSDELIASFLNYIAADERIVIDKVMSSDATEDAFSSDELLELLDQFKRRSKINKDNAREVVIEIARQEIIQKLHLMSSCWQIHSKKPEFSDVDYLSKFYEKLEPSAKKIVALLMTDPKDDAEREAFGFFKRFVRGLDIVHLKKLLKFLTGSDMIIVSSIKKTCRNYFSWWPGDPSGPS